MVETTSARNRALTPLLWLSNALFAILYLPVTRGARVRWNHELIPQYRLTSEHPLIFYSWHRFSWCAFSCFRRLPPSLRPVIIANDSLLSSVNHRAGARLGLDTLVFKLHGSLSPRDQIVAFLNKYTRHLLLFPDSGGPYGALRPGFLEISRRTGALPVPFTCRVRGKLVIGRTMRHVVPMPGCLIELSHGPPLDAGATLAQCTQALHALE